MKVYYLCECCEDCVDELEFTEVELDEMLQENLTDSSLHDIIRMQLGTSRTYLPTICDDCLASIDWDDGGVKAYPVN